MARLLSSLEFTIANRLRNFSLTYGGNGERFYVGITNDIQRRLFDEHQVDEETGCYSVATATSHDSAGKIEKYLLDTYPFEGDTGGGNEQTIFVYIYLITDNTREKTNENKEFDDLDLLKS